MTDTDTKLVHYYEHINNDWDFRAARLSGPVPLMSHVYSVTEIYTTHSVHATNRSQHRPGGGEHRMTWRRQESSPQPADRGMTITVKRYGLRLMSAYLLRYGAKFQCYAVPGCSMHR